MIEKPISSIEDLMKIGTLTKASLGNGISFKKEPFNVIIEELGIAAFYN